ncbi:MAG: hypothetical protein RBS19_03850 [Bacteroidales bacterium]|nr:hypothetical protein [Bacteroidales bacterium]
MKHIPFIIGLLLLTTTVSNGQDSTKFIFNEFCVSINRTNVQNLNTSNMLGFGLGVYQSFMTDKKFNPKFGLEFNRTSQFFTSINQGHFAHSTDVTYTYSCLSIPFGFRYSIGSKTKIFIETGGFVDIVLAAREKGTQHNYVPINNQYNYTKSEFDKKTKLSDTYGVYLGLGVRVPISNYELIIKPEYKFAFNTPNSNYDEILNRYFKLSVGMSF